MLLLFGTVLLNGQSKQQYADWLYAQGDYYRAISEYKELLFYSTVPDSADQLRLRIGKSYFRSGKHDNSIAELSAILEHSAPDQLRSAALDLMALNYLNLSLPNQALYFSAEAKKIGGRSVDFTNALIRANLYQWDDAAAGFAAVRAGGEDDVVGRLAKRNVELVEGAKELGTKSPLAATLMSAVIPGSGQLYAGHSMDALQSFVFVASFAYVSSLAHRYDKQHGGPYYNTGVSLSLTSLFYAANLIGAERTATYYNQRQRQDLVKRINEGSLDLY